MSEFFVALGLSIETEATVDGDWLRAVYGPAGIDADIVMLSAPEGNGRVELARYRLPEPVMVEPRNAPASAIGLRRMTFEVTDLDEVLSRLSGVGSELIGDVATREGSLRLCYVRGPEGVIVTLAERL